MKREILKGVLFTFALFDFQTTFSQERDPIALDKVAPPSPELAQLGKYGNVPVNHSTGAISVAIPIFTIKTPAFEWPISLTYHSGGIRVDEISSCVGTGWSINAISAISRSIVGTPDENGLLHNTVPFTTSAFSALSETERRNIVTGNEDMQPDLFSFNFNGKSGTFQLHRDKGVMLESDDNIRIAFNGTTFTVVDEQGNTYSFNQLESGASRIYDAKNVVTTSSTVYDGVVGWYLTKVESQDKSETITFNYGSTYNVTQYQDQYAFKIGEQGFFNGSECLRAVQQPAVERTAYQLTNTYSPQLTEILFSNGKLTFNYLTDRIDMGLGTNKIGNMGRLISVDVYNKTNTTYELFQKIKLDQSYFTSDNLPADKNPCYASRLRLDGVNTFDKNGAPISSGYKLYYHPNKLPYRTSPSQDFWGFANGSNNVNLVPRRIISYNFNGGPVVYDLGNANRNADSISMLACVLNKVIYPTGGYSFFEYEPHKFYDPNLVTTTSGTTTTTTVEEKVTATPGSLTHIATKQFQHIGPSQTVSITAFFKAYYGKSDAPPYVRIKEVVNSTTFTNVLTINSSDAYNDKFETASYTLVNNKQYILEAYVHAGSYPVDEVYSSGQLFHSGASTTTSGTTTMGGYRIVGGLRIKTISNFSPESKLATKEVYNYGSVGDGVLIAHTGIFNRDYINVKDKVLKRDPDNPENFLTCSECPFSYRLYTDQSPYALGSISGSLVGYTRVEKRQVDSDDKALGSEVFTYDIVPDDFGVIADMDNYFPIPRSWKNGKIVGEETYRTEADGATFKTASKDYAYQEIRTDVFNYLIIGSKTSQNCDPANLSNYNVTQGKKYYGKKFPLYIIATSTNKTADGTILTMVDTTWYQYSASSSHNNPLQITRRESKGRLLHDFYYYPQDMITELGDGSAIFSSMTQKGITGELVLHRSYIESILSKEEKTEYSAPYSSFIKPSKFYVKLQSNPSELYSEATYTNYARLSEQSLKNNVKTTYLWGYNKTVPVARIVGAGISATNGLFNQAVLDAPASDQALRDEVQKVRMGLASSKAQVYTYTYKPLVGLTSQTEPDGTVAFFVYDNFGRLSFVRDQDDNILKKYCYNYQGQVENCGLPYTVNVAYSNTTGNGTCTIQFINVTTGISNTFTVGTSGGPLGSIPQGTYTVTATVNNNSSGAKYKFDFGCKLLSTSSSAAVYNVYIGSNSCNTVNLSIAN